VIIFVWDGLREDGDAVEKPEPVERAETAEMKRDGTGAAARES
jgi:hypothetical protein